MIFLSTPGGGTAISEDRVLFVETTGNNASAEVGNPGKAYQTAQAAFDAAVALTGNYLLKFGVGSFGTIVVPTGGWPSRIAISGCGYSVSRLTGINGSGANGAAGTNHDTAPTSGAAGSNGKAIAIRSDGTINLGVIESNGGNAGASGSYLHDADVGAVGSTGAAGAAGGNAGPIELVGVVYDSISAHGGNGAVGGTGQNGGGGTSEVAAGNGGDGGAGGNAGIRNTLVMYDCLCTSAGGGDVESTNGEFGSGGAGGTTGIDGGAGAGASGSPGGDGTIPTGFDVDLIFVRSGVGTISSVTTDGEEVALNTCYVGCVMDGSSGVIAGDLGGNIETTFHKLP